MKTKLTKSSVIAEKPRHAPYHLKTFYTTVHNNHVCNCNCRPPPSATVTDKDCQRSRLNLDPQSRSLSAPVKVPLFWVWVPYTCSLHWKKNQLDSFSCFDTMCNTCDRRTDRHNCHSTYRACMQCVVR